MSWLRFCVLSAVLCSFAVVGQDGVPKPGDTKIIPVPPKNAPEPPTTSEPAPDTPPAADPKPDPAPSTPAPAPPITTPAPNTTTPVPPTTPPAPPTTPPTPPTTTPAPTTTTPAPTPAPAPKPLPPAEQGKWMLKQNNVTCIVVQFAAQFAVTYAKVNSSNRFDLVTLNVPKNATVDEENSSCSGNGTQWLTLTWPATDTTNNITLVFYRNDTTKNYALKSFNVSLAHELFPNATFNGSLALYHDTVWLTPLATSYRCYTPTKLNMTAVPNSAAKPNSTSDPNSIGDPNSAAVLTLSQLQEEAFRTSSGEGFSAARECGGGDVPDAVPIAVGCALGGLVVVVLIAYLVGRRRSAARGYLSM